MTDDFIQKDETGDELTVFPLQFNDKVAVLATCDKHGVEVWLTPKQARKLAKRLKAFAAEVEAR